MRLYEKLKIAVIYPEKIRCVGIRENMLLPLAKEVKMKNILKYALVLALAFALTGCFPTGELETSSATSVSKADSGVLSEPAAFTVPNDLKNVKFNFGLNENYPSEVPVIKAKMRNFDVEALKARFIDGKDIIKETPNDHGGAFHTSDGITLYANQGRFSYTVEHLFGDAEKREVYSAQSNAASNLRYFFTDYHQLDSELEGFSRAEALERANELVEELDIKFLGEPSVYAFTLEELETYLGKSMRFDKDGSKAEVQLTKEDEFYLVRYYGEYGGITMPGEIERIFEDAFAYNTQVDIILTKDSLVKFTCNHVFDSIEAIDTTQMKCGADTAISKVYEYYRAKDNVMDYRLEYDSFGISYVTYKCDYNAGEVTFKPLWHLAGRQYYNTDGVSGDVYADKFADPVTGMVYDAGV